MNGQQWASVEDHFDRLRELSGEQRANGMDAIDDEDVRREVAALLQHSKEGETLAAVVGSMAARLENGPREDRIGPYRLVRRLGQGGQATVFEAVRDDGRFTRRVAIKIVKWDIDSEEARRRFRDERQILAGLEHPYIAQLLDGGETADGTPYLVMEFIDGLPLAQATEGWALRRKLELFLKITEAVAVAHRNLIVHRDLKPNNILVTNDGPKLLDFGIAKLLDPAVTCTQTALIALTPEYASPEQLRGERITTASDVYSLGVVLYELTTGRKPYTFETRSPLELDRVICQQPPAPARIDSELDAILAMTLRKEPERRYHGVEPLAEDIRCYLEARPVLARPDTVTYRTTKYLRRHWIGLLAAAITLGGLLGGATVALYQARRAEHRFQQVRNLANSFLFEFHDKIANLPGSTEARELIVKKALEYLGPLAAEAGNDRSLQWELAEAYQKVGDVQGTSQERAGLGHTAEAQKSYEMARQILEKLDRTGRLSDQQLASLSSVYTKLGAQLCVGRNLGGCLQLYRQSLATAERISPASPGRSWLVGDVLFSIAEGEGRIGDDRQAIKDYQAAIDILRAGGASPKTNAAAYLRMIKAQRRVASNLQQLGDLNAAARNLEPLPGMTQSLLEIDPHNTTYQTELFWISESLGNLYGSPDIANLGNRELALQHLRRGLSLAEAIAAADLKNATAQRNLAGALENLGDVVAVSSPAEALVVYRRKLSIIDSLLKLDPDHSIHRRMRGAALTSLAQPLIRLRRLEEARRTLRDGIEAMQTQLAADPTRFSVQDDLVTAYTLQGDLERAENRPDAHGAYLRAAELGRKASAEHPGQIEELARLSTAYERLGALCSARARSGRTSAAQREADWREAHEWYSKSLEIWTDWRKHATSSVYDRRRREEVARALAESDAGIAGGLSAKVQNPAVH